MKINVKEISYDKFLELEKYKHKKPMKRSFLLASVIRVISYFELLGVKFKYNSINMDKLKKNEPCLVLINHSSFIDLKVASKLLYPRKYNIVCTDDGFVGKEFLMRWLGCIPTKKFISDTTLVRDMLYCTKNLDSSILMFPEASYSFDGKATPLPTYIGKCLKFLKVPLVVIRTYGAFSRDPLYNNLQIRKVNVSADIEYVLSKDEIASKTEKELTDIVNSYFNFDNFKWQQDNKISIKEKFRADHLNRILYKCPHCNSEGVTEGKGIHISCSSCGAKYQLDEYGYLKNENGDTIFDSVPKWSEWERECVKKEIIDGTYLLDCDVDIYALKNLKSIYKIGTGHLIHNSNGFKLTGCDGKLDFSLDPGASYSLYSDFNWYEIGDIICIGDNNVRYYLVPKNCKDVVAKARLATEEMYKLNKK